MEMGVKDVFDLVMVIKGKLENGQLETDDEIKEYVEYHTF